MLTTAARNFGFSENDVADRQQQGGGSSGVASRNSTVSGFGLAWDARRGRWISLVYRYVFPKSSFINESGSQIGVTPRKGRFEFGPCKQHHLTIGQSPFVRRQQHMAAAAAARSMRRKRRYNPGCGGERSSRLSHISEENLMSFLTEPESHMNSEMDDDEDDDRGMGSLVHLVEDDETTLLNDFLSSAVVDHGPGGGFCAGSVHQSWNAIDGQLVAPSSPPPPLFLDESPELDSMFRY